VPQLKKKIAFLTLGCKVNQYDTQLIRETFLANLYQEVKLEESPEIIIINSCTVTGKSDQKLRKIVRSLKAKNPQSFLIVTGCYAERASQELQDVKEIDLIVDNKKKYDILSMLDTSFSIHEQSRIIDLSVKNGLEDHTRAFVKIQDGCESFCSYCIIPYVRGPIQSKTQDVVLSEITHLLERGIKEVVLVGIHVGKYGKERKPEGELYELLQKIEQLPQQFRCRLSSIEINELDNELLKFLAKSHIMPPHFHIPLQSGDDTTLKRMNRHYNTHDFLEKCDFIRSLWQYPAFTTDVIVGFPGETEEQFQNTLHTCTQAKFAKIHVFPYSDRTGTPASRMSDKVSDEVKRDRVHRLTELSQQLTAQYLQGFIGKTVRVLVETEESNGMLSGLSDEYQRVFFPGDISLKNTFVNVYINKQEDDILYGAMC